MTWAKLQPEMRLRAIRHDLSDSAYRAHTDACLYLYEQEDPSLRIPRRMLPLITGATDPLGAAEELVAARYWKAAGDDWVLIADANTIKSGLAAQWDRRDQNRAAQARHRAAKAARDGGDVSADVSADGGERISAYQASKQASNQETRSNEKTEQGPGPAQLRAVPGGLAGKAALQRVQDRAHD